MAIEDVRYVTATLGDGDRTRPLHLGKALGKFEDRIADLKPRADGLLQLNFENNAWPAAIWVTPDALIDRARQRLDGAKMAGADVFARGIEGAQGYAPIVRIKSVEVYKGTPFSYSGEMSDPLRRLCEDLWAVFGDDDDLSNGGIHVCRRISGSTSWSQHSWYDAIDLMIGSDMKLGDDINRWLKSNQNKYGGYAELLWRVESHYDHIHLSLAPRHLGTPPCAG